MMSYEAAKEAEHFWEERAQLLERAKFWENLYKEAVKENITLTNRISRLEGEQS